jgi:hypothetical protein
VRCAGVGAGEHQGSAQHGEVGHEAQPIRWLERYVEWWDDRGRQNADGPTPMSVYWMWVVWSVCAVMMVTTLAIAAA